MDRIHRPIRWIAFAVLLAVSVLFIGACGPKGADSASGGSPSAANTSNPTEFLKWSMSRHAALKSYSADCTWNADYGGLPEAASGTGATRTLLYSAPNKFKIVASHVGGQFVQTSTSDGKEVLDLASGMQGGAMKSPAPKTIADANSMQMGHPMFCGSLLYKFFGGPGALAGLAQESKQPLQFGADVTLDGDACKTVSFYGTSMYGRTEVAIRKSDGMVKRIKYGSEPLLEMMKGQTADKAPTSMTTTEEYKNIKVDAAIADKEFVISVPAGQKVLEMPAMPSESSAPPLPVGSPAPEFTLTGLDGKSLKLSNLRGKVVLIDFWATWCPPCRKGLPETQKIHDEFSSKGLSVLAVSSEDKATVSEFVKKNSYHFPAYLDPNSRANDAYKVEAIPTVVIIDKEGKLAAYMVGLQAPERIREELKKAGI
jgi:peroxiredoxin/outer membrane lipoprotein-sorting protein